MVLKQTSNTNLKIEDIAPYLDFIQSGLSILLALFLFIFMLVQSALAQNKRHFGYYILFSTSWGFLAFIEMQKKMGMINDQIYELVLLFWPISYSLAIMGLMRLNKAMKVVISMLLTVIGLMVWKEAPELQSGVTFSLAFFIGFVLHTRYFLMRKGYSSAVLSATSLACAIQLSINTFWLDQSIDKSVISDAQFVFLNVLAVFWGWSYFPAEINSHTIIRVSRRYGTVFIMLMGFSQFMFTWSYSVSDNFYPYLLGMIVQAFLMASFHFIFKSKLVSHSSEILDYKEQVKKQTRRDYRLLHGSYKRAIAGNQAAFQSAHDMQNLVAVAYGIADDLQNTNDPERKSKAVELRKIIEQMDATNDHVLALSRPSSRVSIRAFAANELILDVVGQLSMMQKDIESILEEDIWIKADYAMMHRVLSNLINNASQAYSKQSKKQTIFVSCGKTNFNEPFQHHLGELPAGEYAFISIEDHGDGIPKENLHKIFELQFSTKRDKSRSGTGLGLSLVKGTLEDVGGGITVKSSTGEGLMKKTGTTFTLYIPMSERPHEFRPLKELRGGERILVVDDEISVCKSFDELLSDLGYRVEIAESGGDALSILSNKKIDLMILDNILPEMKAYQIHAYAMKFDNTIPTIVYSGFMTEKIERDLKNAGVEEIITKPVNNRDLIVKVRQLLDESKEQKNRGNGEIGDHINVSKEH